MAQPTAVIPPQQGAVGRQQQQQGGGGFMQSISGIIRMAAFWYFAMKFFGPKPPPMDPGMMMSNIFQKGEPLDMWLYLSEQEKFYDFGNEGALVWHETNVPYAVWGPSSSRSHILTYHPSEAVKHNGTLYAHAFFARSGYPPDPSDPEYDALSAFGRTVPVVKYLPKKKDDKRRSLLGKQKESEEKGPVPQDDSDPNAVDKDHVQWVSYWKPNITLNLVDDFTRYPQNSIPPNIAGCIHRYSFFFSVSVRSFMNLVRMPLSYAP